MNEKEKIKFLGKIVIQFSRSRIAYNNYLTNGKTFIFAKILKNSNQAAQTLLLENSYLLSDNLIADSLKLIAHFDIWMEKWNDLANSKFFKLEEEFSFENSFTFPKEAAKNLEKEFLKFREKIS